jgi:hypothetical protein
VDVHGRFPSVGFAHLCSLAAVVCGSHPGYPAGHPEVFPYSAGYDPAVDEALATVDAARKTQMTAPGLQEPAKKAPATCVPQM